MSEKIIAYKAIVGLNSVGMQGSRIGCSTSG